MGEIFQPTDISQILLQVLVAIAILFFLGIWSSRFRPVVKGPEKGDITFLMWGEEEFGGLTHEWVDATSDTTLSWLEDMGVPEGKGEVWKKFLELCKVMHVYGVRDSKMHKRVATHIGKILFISPRNLEEGNLRSVIGGRWYLFPYPHRGSETIVIIASAIDWGVQQIPEVGTCRVITGIPITREELDKAVNLDSKIEAVIKAVQWKDLKEITPRAVAIAESKQVEAAANARIAEAEDAKRKAEEDNRTLSDERDYLATIVAKIQAEGGGGDIKSIVTPVRAGFGSLLLLATVGYVVAYTQLPLVVDNLQPMFAGLIGLVGVPLFFLWRRGLLHL